MYNFTIRIIAGAAVVVFLSGGICHGDLAKDLQGIKREISEKKSLLTKTKKVETKVSGELDRIQKSLRDKENNLKLLNRDLSGVENQLGKTRSEIDRVAGEADRKKDQIRHRLASVYKAGDFSSTRMFFSSESFPQMVENVRYMNAVLNNDRKLFNEYGAKIEDLKGLKSSLENDMDRKEKIKTSIEVKKKEIEEEKQKKAAYLEKIRDEKKGYQASLKNLQANARRLQTMVERLEAARRKSYSKRSNRPSIGGGKELPPVPDKGFASQKGRLSIPVRGDIIGTFGRHKHPEFNSYTVSNGISIAAPSGAEIRPIYDGTVIFADYFKGYGNMVIVDHGGGFFSLYGHVSRIMKKVGSNVSRGEVIATVGDVDSSRGPMLYMEIRYQGKPVDPLPWFRNT